MRWSNFCRRRLSAGASCLNWGEHNSRACWLFILRPWLYGVVNQRYITCSCLVFYVSSFFTMAGKAFPLCNSSGLFHKFPHPWVKLLAVWFFFITRFESPCSLLVLLNFLGSFVLTIITQLNPSLSQSSVSRLSDLNSPLLKPLQCSYWVRTENTGRPRGLQPLCHSPNVYQLPSPHYYTSTFWQLFLSPGLKFTH